MLTKVLGSGLLTFLLIPRLASADLQIVPIVDDSPSQKKPVTNEDFEFLHATLHASRLAPFLQCEYRISRRKSLRKFSDHEEWVEFLNLQYKTNAVYGGHKMEVSFPIGSEWARKTVADIHSGRAEDIQWWAGDSMGHWLRFKHDGQGQIVMMQMGDDLRTLPCVDRSD